MISMGNIKEFTKELKEKIIESENSIYLRTSQNDGVLDIIDKLERQFANE